MSMAGVARPLLRSGEMDGGQREFAIQVRGAHKGYGSLRVLKGLDMSVPRGHIYGLLGSSGCGKTTLLRCILGRLNLENGYVKVLGKAPGSTGHHIPGRDVGYMPQELALYGEFTTTETMYYFGILNGMSRGNIKQRMLFLLELLELPQSNKLIGKLSGGQQRRFSFAVAMLQKPPLLILDEPTVGVDPLLRSRIWHHLLEIASDQTTIVITTHYIEEARQAHLVGLMRDGILLAEDAPTSLIQSHCLSTLEDVFLKLCKRQEEEKTVCCGDPLTIQTGSPSHHLGSPSRHLDTYDDKDDVDEKSPLLQSQTGSFVEDIETPENCCSSLKKSFTSYLTGLAASAHSCRCSTNPHSYIPHPTNVLALTWKNFVRIYRNPGLVLFQFILPTLQVALFCLAVGGNLKGVKMAYVNQDQGFVYKGAHIPLAIVCTESDPQYGGLTNISSLGELYVSKLLADPTFDMINCSTPSEAIGLVREGTAWSAVVIDKNFTNDLFQRICSVASEECNKLTIDNKTFPVTDEIIDQSTVHLYSDLSNAQISITIQNQTMLAYEQFLDQLVSSCSNRVPINTSVFSPPVKVEDPPVYGKKGLSFTDYMGPGVITSVTFGISIGLTAVALLIERNEGLLDRSWVAGVNTAELIISQVITQFIIIIVQIALLISITIWAFKIYNTHTYNVWLIGLLALVQGMTGMAFGLFLSAICSSESAALQAAVAAFYPTMLLSGVIWPFEGMPKWLQYISGVLPATYPAQAMRAIMGRGWGLAEYEVWRGFTVSSAWFIFFLFLAGLAFSLRK